VVEVAVVGVEVEVRCPLFRLVYEGFYASPSSLWFWVKEKAKKKRRYGGGRCP
jgi:hypothetical protein